MLLYIVILMIQTSYIYNIFYNFYILLIYNEIFKKKNVNFVVGFQKLNSFVNVMKYSTLVMNVLLII